MKGTSNKRMHLKFLSKRRWVPVACGLLALLGLTAFALESSISRDTPTPTPVPPPFQNGPAAETGHYQYGSTPRCPGPRRGVYFAKARVRCIC